MAFNKGTRTRNKIEVQPLQRVIKSFFYLYKTLYIFLAMKALLSVTNLIDINVAHEDKRLYRLGGRKSTHSVHDSTGIGLSQNILS